MAPTCAYCNASCHVIILYGLADNINETPAEKDKSPERRGKENDQELPDAPNPRQLLSIIKEQRKAPRRQSECVVVNVRDRTATTKKVKFIIPLESAEEQSCIQVTATEKGVFVTSVLRDEVQNEEVILTSGQELLTKLKLTLEKETPFTSRRSDELRASFRFFPKLGTVKEDDEFQVRADDRRYGLIQSDSEAGISDSGSDWSGPDVYMECDCVTPLKYLLCCHCCRKRRPRKTPTFSVKWVEDKTNTGGEVKDDTRVDEYEEDKPKHVGKMKRFRNFLKRIFCCGRKNSEE
ncbi:uncharacterized protein LOC134249302 [Saccostrea cucullata]|uniref:uncharacterized protein LOC134249302 n=1 Tax=Saccostrea cuccullata TaxID=36930 RepID=UPI002ED32BDA